MKRIVFQIIIKSVLIIYSFLLLLDNIARFKDNTIIFLVLKFFAFFVFCSALLFGVIYGLYISKNKTIKELLFYLHWAEVYLYSCSIFITIIHFFPVFFEAYFLKENYLFNLISLFVFLIFNSVNLINIAESFFLKIKIELITSGYTQQ